jgi:hypothetical protein
VNLADTNTLSDIKSGGAMLAPITSLNDPCLLSRYLVPKGTTVSKGLSTSEVAAIAVALAELLPDEAETGNDTWNVVGRARAVGRASR